MKELARQAYDLFGIRLTQTQLKAFERYQQSLLAWNTQYNLTAIRDVEQIRAKHFLDSLSCALAMRGVPIRRMIDIGTGAGFPGLPLKILFPEIQLSLVDSVQKKINFCQHVVDLLGLEGVTFYKARAEELGQQGLHRGKYDWAVGRAVAVLSVIVEYLLPLVSVGGHVIAMKGENAPAETQAAEHAIRILGGELRQLIPVSLPGVAEGRYLVVIDKVAETSLSYPRRAGLPSKHPLHPSSYPSKKA